MTPGGLDISTLESWHWEAACKIRGDIDAPWHKDYILSLGDAMVLLRETEEARVESDTRLKEILDMMGLEA